MRCPNAACRKVFAVPVEEPPPPTAPRPGPQPDNGQRSGSVGDMVPILPAEQAAPPLASGSTSKNVFEVLPVEPTEPAEPARREQPSEADWWHAAPPVRQSPQQPAAAPTPSPSAETWWREAPPASPAPEAPPPHSRPARRSPKSSETTQRKRPDAPTPSETQQMPALPAESTEQPRELPPGEWEPPPVRRGVADTENETQAAATAPESEQHQPRLSKRRARLVIVGLIVVTFGTIGLGVLLVLKTLYRSEAALAKQADDFYGQGSFTNASDKFNELTEKFRDSASIDKYRFMADWSKVCNSVSGPDADLAASIPSLGDFLKNHKNDPLMAQKGQDAGGQLLTLTKNFAARNTNPPDEQPLKDADRIEEMRRIVASLDPEALTKEDTAAIESELGKVRRAVELAGKRRNVLAQLRKKDNETWMDAIKRVRDLLGRMERELPGISEAAEGRTALAGLYDGHRASVVFHPRQEDVPQPQQRPEDDGMSLVFDPLLPTAAPGKAPKDDPIVLALVRGVLYALKQSTGAIKWATRVGIDTTVLPLRVPASQASPELLLVLSADTQTLSALDLDSRLLWEYPIGQRVLGRPVVIDQRAYLAAYDGWVHEIELSRGELLGRWYLGQRLTRGGAREEDTHRIYFPADDSCIYVLDVGKERKCLNILYDGHRSGSLRSEPIVIPPPPVRHSGPGYLILNEANGLDAMQLKVFELPLQGSQDAPVDLKSPARLPGWTWFEPRQDSEKLTILSDAGVLGLFGIRQPGNSDPALFPLLQTGGLDLSRFLRKPERDLPRERGRSQVVHMQGDDLWVLAKGRLQQVHLGWKDTLGPQATAGWKAPLALGSPLHEPQRYVDPKTGLSVFVLVTQALEQQTCLATAVDEKGHLRWQRQLGLVCQGEPLALTPPEGGAPLLLALDQGGGLFALDPQHPAKWRYLKEGFAENPRVPPRLLPGPDGHTAYEVAAPGEGRTLLVRRIEWAGDELHVKPVIKDLSLVSPNNESTLLIPAGPPVAAGTQILIPMSDGFLWRLLLEESDKESGPNWRDELASPTAPGHVLPLGGDRILLTDGSRGLRVYKWPPGKSSPWQELPRGRESPTPLDSFVAAPPVLLPPRDGQPRFAIADSAGLLHLFIVKADGSLQRGLTWDLAGRVTMGPFVYTTSKGEPRLGCVLDRRRLIWIDPDKQDRLWEYSSEGAVLIGPPTQIENLLVVALQSGHYIGLDPETGQPKGRGYTLRTSAAPAATPMPFGAGLMFTPLSDGTALLLSLEHLGEPAKK